MQYTCPDLMYSVSRISSYAAETSATVLQGIKHLIWYLAICPRCPIIYTYLLYVTKTHEPRQEFTPGDFH